ncbi:SapC family protein [Vreelandella aquamarina]|uniref:SapC family protein n=1 Tax=Vreelandella aquamarina TaxID=77097 RepID=UPI003851380C
MLNEYLSHIPLSYAEHAHLGWRFSLEQVLKRRYKWLPISLSELARTSAYFPVVIVQQRQRWSMAVLLDESLELQANLQGSEAAKERFLPMCLQAYPFSLQPSADNKSGAQLCVAESALATLKERGTLPLFGENRQFSASVIDRYHLLYRIKIDAEIAHSACELLARKGVLILISDVERQLTRIKDHSVPLYRINIDAIGRLSREDFADLQMHHAMELGIYQYSSLFHVNMFHHYS